MKSVILSRLYSLFLVFLFSLGSLLAQDGVTFLKFNGGEGPGKGKHVVLVSGDDEYRSEESMPMLAKILSKTYGFDCTVLFAIEPESGNIVPNYQQNISNLEALADADLMIMLIRFRDLPSDQMKHFESYFKAGKPFIALRTSTHPFAIKDANSAFSNWNWNNKTKGWEGGFGQQVIGETWVAHHGVHGKEGTRAMVDGVNLLTENPILAGVNDIWGPSDVYSVKNLPSTANVLLMGQSTAGMTAEAPLMWEKSLMPIAWTKDYQLKGGKKGQLFASTMGASLDFQSEDLRRLVINAAFSLLDMDSSISPDMPMDIIGDYAPTPFGFDTFRKGMKVADFK